MLVRRLMYVWVCCSASLVALPKAAHACLYGTDFEIGDVRANGMVELRWHCRDRFCSDGDVPNPLRIVDDATNAEVPGAVVWSHGVGTMAVDLFWKATEPLVAGRTYRVLDLPRYAEGRNAFTVSPAVTWVHTDELELEANLDLQEGRAPGEISCPARYKRGFCFPAMGPSPKDVTLDTRRRTYLWISAFAMHPSGWVPPMKRRAVYWRDGDAPPDIASKAWSLSSGSERIFEGAERYCYRTAVQSLLDGSERVWEGCLEHGDLPELATRAASPEDIAEETQKCLEPPAGLEQEWCEQSMIACARDYTATAPGDCENVAMRCTTHSEPAQPEDDEDAGAASGNPRKVRMSAPHGSGCSAPSAPTGGTSPLLLVAGLAAAALRRRRLAHIAQG